MVSTETNPPIEEVMPGVALCVLFLNPMFPPAFNFEASWALANVASMTHGHAKLVIDSKAVPVFLDLLISASYEVREQAVRALGNIAGDSRESRLLLLEEDALDRLLEQGNYKSTLRMLRYVAMALFNFSLGDPPLPFHLVPPVLSSLQYLVYVEDQDVISYSCGALAYLLDGSIDKIQREINPGLYPRLVELLMHPLLRVQIAALRSVRIIARGDNVRRQYIIDQGALLSLRSLLTHDNTTIKNEACLIISAITAGNENQNQEVIDARLIEPLFSLLQSGEPDISEKAGKAVLKVISRGNHYGIKGLQNCVQQLCDLLLSPDPMILEVGLKGIASISKPSEAEKCSEDFNFLVKLIDEAGGLDKIEDLKMHENCEISKKAKEIWKPLYSEALKVWKYFEDLGDLFV
ncbi:OLC1v1015450C2 [Oldenlandia corymbosa var. corymbosa]|nr:OLC1v1015450C2 [Oldenlandia corymbosa var. corymbosa]